MEIQYISFEDKLFIVSNNQKIAITPFFIPGDPANIKLGIDAPKGISVNREEIYKKKKTNNQV